MSVRREKRYHFEEIPLPLMKVWRTGNSYVFTLPSRVVAKYDINVGDEFIVVLFKRKLRYQQECKPDEEVVVMDRKTYEEFKEYRKNAHSELSL